MAQKEERRVLNQATHGPYETKTCTNLRKKLKFNWDC